MGDKKSLNFLNSAEEMKRMILTDISSGNDGGTERYLKISHSVQLGSNLVTVRAKAYDLHHFYHHQTI